MGYISYAIKVKQLKKYPLTKVCIAVRDINMMMVNLADAKNVLSREDFDKVMELYQLYDRVEREFDVDFNGFVSLCDDIIVSYDMIAPYYKFCGSKEYIRDSAEVEAEKALYRNMVHDTLERCIMFGEVWIKFHDLFKSKFYSEG